MFRLVIQFFLSKILWIVVFCLTRIIFLPMKRSFFLKININLSVGNKICFVLKDFCKFFYILLLTLRRPLRRKLRIRWFFDVSKLKESSFVKSDLTHPSLDFWCASFGNYRFKPFQISFLVGFISRSCFESDGFIAYSNEWDWREKEGC